MEVIQSALLEAGTTIVVALISLLAIVAVLYINKLKAKVIVETEKINDQATREYAQGVLTKVTDALSIAVDKMESTMVKELKDKSSDGKLTKEEQKEIADQAKKLANEILGTDMKNLLVGIIGDSEKYVDAQIASLVIKKKNELLGKTEDSSPLNS
jgi:nitrogen-specific signal transduction histidine kinase